MASAKFTTRLPWLGCAFGGPLGNGPEILSFQARAADQGAIYLRHRHQFGSVGGFHRPAIKDAHGGPTRDSDRQQDPNVAMHGLDIAGCRGLARTDRPDRFIGNHDIFRASACSN